MMTLRTADRDTPKRRANSAFVVRHKSQLARISMAWVEDSLAIKLRSPGSPARRLPLLAMSTMLSKFVPIFMCRVLQHAVLSHECIRTLPFGMGSPQDNSQAIRWARSDLSGLNQTIPYPFSLRDSFHSQHSSGPRRSTRAQNSVAVMTHSTTP